MTLANWGYLAVMLSPQNPRTAPNADRFAPLDPPNGNWGKFPHFAGRTYLANHLNIELEEVRTDYARMTMPFHEEVSQPAGVMHGGAITSLIDTTAVPALGSALERRPMMFTIDLGVQFLAPAAEAVVCEVWIRQRGRSICFCQSEVHTVSGTLVATANLTYKLSSRDLKRPTSPEA